MVSLADALTGGARDAYCSLSAPIANGVSALGDLNRAGGNGIAANGLSQAAQLLRNAQDVFCDRVPSPVGNNVAPPFSGGQCPGQSYFVQVSASVTDNQGGSSQNSTSFTVPGPIRSFIRSDFGEGVSGSSAVISYGDGIELPIVGSTSTVPGFEATAQFDSIDVSTVNGESDDCGDPPEQAPPYSPDNWTAPRTINYDGPGGSPTSTDVDFTFGPTTVGPDGGLLVPTVILFDNDVEANFNLDLNIGELNLFPSPGQPGSEVTDPQEQEEEDGESEEETEIIGVRVISTRGAGNVRTTEVGQSGGNPNILLPRTANVSFLYRTGDGRSGWGEAIPVQGENYVIWAERPALRVAGTAGVGWTIQLFPIVQVKSGCCGE